MFEQVLDPVAGPERGCVPSLTRWRPMRGSGGGVAGQIEAEEEQDPSQRLVGVAGHPFLDALQRRRDALVQRQPGTEQQERGQHHDHAVAGENEHDLRQGQRRGGEQANGGQATTSAKAG